MEVVVSNLLKFHMKFFIKFQNTFKDFFYFSLLGTCLSSDVTSVVSTWVTLQ